MKECCSWRGIECNTRTGHISTIDLSLAYDLNDHPLIVRNLSSSLFPLRHHLTKLVLSNVDFGHRTLPLFIGHMKKLKVLRLQSCSISGIFPYGILTNLSSLEILDLSYNSFEDIRLSRECFQNQSKFSSLRLSSPNLSSYCNSIWLPPFQLKYLDLAECHLGSRFPTWLQSQKNLVYVDLSGHGILGHVPTWLWDLSPRVMHFDLSFNQLSGKLPDLSKKFREPNVAIFLKSNHFEGSLPMLPASFSILHLANNKFSGELIDSLCSVIDVVDTIDFSRNLLTGEIPYCLRRWKHIRNINLAHNQLSGSVPASIASCLRLTALNLRNNSLSGTLPYPLRHLRSLILFDVGFNAISGDVPEWIGESMSELSTLILRSNKFNGSLPLTLCYLQNLRILDLAINNLSSTIPSCFQNFTNMVRVSNTSNKDGSFIEFQGRNLARDRYVAMETIFLKGKECEYKVDERQVKSIDLACNNFTGQFNQALTKLVQLTGLNLSHNNFDGILPLQIGQLKSLESLDLSRNKFSGKLPITLAELNFLSDLDISFNMFSGKIPTSSQLQGFDRDRYISNDGLCGLPLTTVCVEDLPVINYTARREGNSKTTFWKYFLIVFAIVFSCGALAFVFGGIILEPIILRWRGLIFTQ